MEMTLLSAGAPAVALLILLLVGLLLIAATPRRSARERADVRQSYIDNRGARRY